MAFTVIYTVFLLLIPNRRIRKRNSACFATGKSYAVKINCSRRQRKQCADWLTDQPGDSRIEDQGRPSDASC